MGVGGVERQFRRGGKVHYFSAGGLQLAAEFLMLRLRHCEVRRMQESQLMPLCSS